MPVFFRGTQLGYAGLIIDRYFSQEISKPLLTICATLVSIFGAYSAARYLGQAASDQLPGQAVATLIVLKIVTVTDILLPMALFLSEVWALGRMHSDEEMTAISAAGVSDLRVLWSVGRLMILVAVLVGTISVLLRPVVFERIYRIEKTADAEFDIRTVQPNRFYIAPGNKRTVYAQEVETPELRRVFVQTGRGLKSSVISARRAVEITVPRGAARHLEFEDGYLYLIDPYGEGDRSVRFERMSLLLDPAKSRTLEYKRRAASSASLLRSDQPKDLAELQWRASAPVSALLLGLLGVFISRSTPRRSRYTKILMAILACALYYNLSAVAGNWVESAKVAAIPGVFWVQFLFALGIGVFAIWPSLLRWRQ